MEFEGIGDFERNDHIVAGEANSIENIEVQRKVIGNQRNLIGPLFHCEFLLRLKEKVLYVLRAKQAPEIGPWMKGQLGYFDLSLPLNDQMEAEVFEEEFHPHIQQGVGLGLEIDVTVIFQLSRNDVTFVFLPALEVELLICG